MDQSQGEPGAVRYHIRAVYVQKPGGEMTAARAFERVKEEIAAFLAALAASSEVAARCGLRGILYTTQEHGHNDVTVHDLLTGERARTTYAGLQEWRAGGRARKEGWRQDVRTPVGR